MPSDNTLRAIITVLDKTAEPLHQINMRFAAMSAPLRRIGSRLSEIAEESGIKNIGEHAAHAFEQVKHLGEGLLEIAGPLAALGAAGSVAGLVEAAKGAAEYAENMHLAAIATGLSTEQLAGWQYAAKLANIDTEQMTKGLQYLNRNIAEAAMGRAKPVAQLFQAMGLHNAPGHLLSTQKALHAVAVEVQHLVGSGHIQLATDLVGQLFGQRSGMALLPIFKEGPKAIEAALAEAARHGLAISGEQAEAGTRFMESFKGMEAAVDGLKVAIGSRLFPVLQPIVDRMTAWLDANRDWLATKIDVAVRSLGDALARVDWGGIVDGMKEAGSWARWIVGDLLGVKGTVALIAAISFAPTILAFGELGAAVASSAAKFVLFPVASLIADFALLIPTIGTMGEVFTALNVAMDANPIGVIVLAAGALIGLGIEIYKHWEQIEHLFERLGKLLPDWAHLPQADPGAGQRYGEMGEVLPPRAAPGTLPSLARLPGGGPAGAAAAQKNETKVTVDFKNAPPGMQASVESDGDAEPDLNVGYAFAY